MKVLLLLAALCASALWVDAAPLGDNSDDIADRIKDFEKKLNKTIMELGEKTDINIDNKDDRKELADFVTEVWKNFTMDAVNGQIEVVEGVKKILNKSHRKVQRSNLYKTFDQLEKDIDEYLDMIGEVANITDFIKNAEKGVHEGITEFKKKVPDMIKGYQDYVKSLTDEVLTNLTIELNDTKPTVFTADDIKTLFNAYDKASSVLQVYREVILTVNDAASSDVKLILSSFNKDLMDGFSMSLDQLMKDHPKGFSKDEIVNATMVEADKENEFMRALEDKEKQYAKIMFSSSTSIYAKGVNILAFLVAALAMVFGSNKM